MFLSVVIPWHRNHDELKKAVDSILSQTWDAFEVIVVANNVSDAAYRQARKLITDPRVQILHSAVKGASPARNLGMAVAKGDLIFFLDADDVFLPEKLATFAAHYRDDPFDLAFSRAIRDRGDGGESLMPVTLWDGSCSIGEFFFIAPGNISTSAIVVTQKAARSLFFDQGATPYEDTDFVIQAEHLGMKLTMLPDPLFRWSDFQSEGRLSKMVDTQTRLAWIKSVPANVPERARAAYRARCVAQHVFPRRFGLCLGLFAQAARQHAVPLHQIGLFMLRGLLPKAPARWLLDKYVMLRMRRGVSS